MNRHIKDKFKNEKSPTPNINQRSSQSTSQNQKQKDIIGNVIGRSDQVGRVTEMDNIQELDSDRYKGNENQEELGTVDRIYATFNKDKTT